MTEKRVFPLLPCCVLLFIPLGARLGDLFNCWEIGAFAGMLLGAALGYWADKKRGAKFETPMVFKPGDFPRIIVFLVLYTVACMVVYYLKDEGLSRGLYYALVGATVIPGVLMVFAFGRAFSNLDELQRRIQTEAIAIGFAGTFLAVTAYGLLQYGGLPELNWFFATPVMVFFYAIGKLVTMRRYR
jgi:hypothetical protein